MNRTKFINENWTEFERYIEIVADRASGIYQAVSRRCAREAINRSLMARSFS